MNNIQTILLNMLKWFHKYCSSHSIRYYAVGGTMIGAMRHRGFIPWDDDIDIAIPRKDYNRLIRDFNNVVDGYLLESPYSGNEDFLYSYAKLYDTNTTLVEKNRKPCKRGIYIDVFPLDGIGNTLSEAQKAFRKVDRKNMLLMTRTCVIKNDRSWYKNASISISRMIPQYIINDKKLSIAIDQMASGINDDNSIYVANLMGAYRSKEITKREYFGKPTLYTFEDTEIYGPEKYDEYLTNIYNDWRKVPPNDKQQTKHDFEYLDLDKSFFL